MRALLLLPLACALALAAAAHGPEEGGLQPLQPRFAERYIGAGNNPLEQVGCTLRRARRFVVACGGGGRHTCAAQYTDGEESVPILQASGESLVCRPAPCARKRGGCLYR